MQRQSKTGWWNKQQRWTKTRSIAMKGIINNIMIFYEMRAEALGILVTNTQEALKELGRKSEVERRAKKLEDFAKDLIVV